MTEPTAGSGGGFRDRVIAEARRQRELRAAGQPIPAECRRYARRCGLVAFLVCSAAFAGVLSVGLSSGSYYVFALLFTAVLALGGLIQAITGIHLLSRR